MTNTENAEKLLEELKICPLHEISKFLEPLIDLIRFLPKEDKYSCAENYYHWARENAKKEPLKYCYGQLLLALVHFTCEKNDLALTMLTHVKMEFEEQHDIEGLGLCGMLTGTIYRTFGNFALALTILWESYEILKRSGKYLVLQAGNANGIAYINLEMHEYDDASSMFKISFDLCEKTGDFYFGNYALLGLGRVNLERHKYAEAKNYFEKALQLANENNNLPHIANAITELANYHFVSGNFIEAEQLHKQALAIRETEHFNAGAVTNYVRLGEVYIKNLKWEDALEVLTEGLKVAEQTKIKLKIYQVHRMLSDLYQGKMDFEKSLYHFKLFQKLREEVEEEDYARKLADAKLIFEAEQTKKENIIIKKQKKEIQKKNIELQETIDELTITRVSRKAKAATLVIAIVLFILQEFILDFVLHNLPVNNYLFSLSVKMVIIFSLSPIDRGIEHYLLKKVVRNNKRPPDDISFKNGIAAT